MLKDPINEYLRTSTLVEDLHDKVLPTIEFFTQWDDRLIAIAQTFEQCPAIGLDTETFGTTGVDALSHLHNAIGLLALYNPNTNVVLLINIDKVILTNSWGEFREIIERIICRSDINIYAHNATYDASCINWHLGLRERVSFRCTLTLTQIYKQGLSKAYRYAGLGGCGLEAIVKELGLSWLYEGLDKKLLQKSDFSNTYDGVLNLEKSLTSDQLRYAAVDAVAAYHVARILAPKLIKDGYTNNLKVLLAGSHAMQLLSVVGFPVNSKFLNSLIDDYNYILSEIDRAIGCTNSGGLVAHLKLSDKNATNRFLQSLCNQKIYIAGVDKIFFKVQKIWLTQIHYCLKSLLKIAIESTNSLLVYKILFVRLLNAICKSIAQELVEPYLIEKTATGSEIDRASIIKSINLMFEKFLTGDRACVFGLALEIASYIQIYLCYSQVHQWHNSMKVQCDKLEEIKKYSSDRGNGYRCYAQYRAIGGDNSYGRTSATKAALQIIPKPSDANKVFGLANVKSVFQASSNYLIAKYDLNGAHGQICSYLAAETIINELGDKGIKFHFYTVQGLLKQLYNRDMALEEIKSIKGDKNHSDYDLISKLYALGKEVYYSYLNCASAKSIQNSILNRSGIIIPFRECESMLLAIKATYRKITKWIDSLKWKAKNSTKVFFSASCQKIATGCTFKLPDNTILRYERIGSGESSYYQLPVITSSHYQCVEGFALLTFLRKHQLSNSPIEVVHHNHDELVFVFPKGLEFEFTKVIESLETHLRSYVPTYRGDLGTDYLGYISTSGHW